MSDIKNVKSNIQLISADILSDKISIRLKALEKLNDFLITRKSEIISTGDIEWDNLYIHCIESISKHSIKFINLKEITRKNQILLYLSVIEKITLYSTECFMNGYAFITPKTIYRGVCSLYDDISSRQYFDQIIIQILNSSFVSIPDNVVNLKINEFSTLLTNVLYYVRTNNNILALKCFVNLLDIGLQFFQLNKWLIDKLPEIEKLFEEKTPKNEGIPSDDLIKLNFLLLNSLYLDYHEAVFNYIHKNFRYFFGFYKSYLKDDSKSSLNSIFFLFTKFYFYNLGIPPPLNENSSLKEKYIRMLYCNVKKHIKDNTNKNITYLDQFIEYSAVVVILLNQETQNCSVSSSSSVSKIQKKNTIFCKIVSLFEIDCLHGQLPIWLSIFKCIIKLKCDTINISDIQTIIEFLNGYFLKKIDISKNITNIRVILEILFHREIELKKTALNGDLFLEKLWEITFQILTDDHSLLQGKAVGEKQLLWKLLIRHRNFNKKHTTLILQNIFQCKTNNLENLEIIKEIIDLYGTSFILKIVNFNDCLAFLLSNEASHQLQDCYLTLHSKIITIMILSSYNHSHSNNQCFENYTEKYNNIIDIKYKYLKDFILVRELKTTTTISKQEILSTENTMNNNSLNTTKFDKYLSYLNLQIQSNDDENITAIDYIGNLTKLSHTIYMYHSFAEFNIFQESNADEHLRKKINLFIDHIEQHTKTISIDNIKDVNKILHIIKLFTKKTVQCSLKEIVLMTPENVSVIVNIVIKLTKSFLNNENHFNNKDEASDLEFIELIKFEILSIYATASFRNEIAFLEIKEYFSAKLNKCSQREMYKNTKLLFKIIESFTNYNIPVTKSVAIWIIDNLKMICSKIGKLRNNIEINNLIVDSLLQVCKSIANFTDLFDNIFIIISSYLKKSYQMYYSVEFNQKLLTFLQEFLQYFPNLILTNNDIRDIYLSVTKFLTSSSLFIQFRVIAFIGFIMNDSQLLFGNFDLGEEFAQFINEMYDKIMNINKLISKNMIEEKSSEDVIKNQRSIIVQMCMTLFLNNNSSTSAFLDLVNFCFMNNLNSSSFIELHQLVKCFHCKSLNDLFYNIIEELISYWIKNSYAFEHFPWFLCSENEYDFYSRNCETIFFSALKYNLPNLVSRVCKKINVTEKQLACKTFEKNYWFLASKMLVNNRFKDSEYSLIKNIIIEYIDSDFNISELHFLWSYKYVKKWKLLAHIVDSFYDEDHFLKIFGFKLFIQISDCDVKVNFTQLTTILRKNNSNSKESYLFHDLHRTEPGALVKLINYIKEKIFSSMFLNRTTLYVYRFIVLTELLQPSITMSYNNTPNEKYFLKDIVSFMSCCLDKFEHVFWIVNAILKLIFQFLKDILRIDETGSLVSFAISTLKKACENSKFHQIKPDILLEIDNIFANISEIKFNQLVKHIEPVLASNVFIGTNIYTKIKSLCLENDNMTSIVMSFLKQGYNVNNVSKLTSSAITKKSDFIQLINNDKFKHKHLPKLINILINIIKNGIENEAIDASKCLGIIGAIYINKYAFICEETESIYNNEIDTFAEEMYIKNLFNAIEKIVFNFDPDIHELVYKICSQIANTNIFTKYENENMYMFEPLRNRKLLINEPQIKFILNTRLNLIEILEQNSKYPKKLIENMSKYIYDNIEMTNFGNLCKTNFSFAQTTFLPLCNLLLYSSKTFKECVIELLGNYFDNSNKINESSPTLCSSTNIYFNNNVIQSFLELTECLRIANDLKIPFNLLNAASLAAYQQANFLAIMYLEMWALSNLENSNYSISNKTLRKNKEFQKTAIKAYKAIDCSDALEGIVDPVSSRLQYLGARNNLLDILIELDGNQSFNDLQFLENLKQNGLLTLSNIINSTHNKKDYEICWRLSQWDVEKNDTSVLLNENEVESNNSLENQFEKQHFLALKAMYEKDQSNVMRSIQNGRKIVIQLFKDMSIECIANLYKLLTKLKLLIQIEDFCNLQFITTSKMTDEALLNNWESEKSIRYGNFHCKEITLTQKITLLEMAGVRATRKIDDFYKGNDAIGSYLLFIIDLCKQSPTVNENFIKRYIVKLKSRGLPHLSAVSDLEDSILCWNTGQKNVALAILKNCIQNKATNATILQKLEAYRLYGQYCVECKQKTFDEMYQKYFSISLQHVENISLLEKDGKFEINTLDFQNFYVDTKRKNYKTIAELADKEFLQVNHHINSSNFKTTIELKNKNRQDAKQIKASSSINKNDTITWNILTKNSNIDEAEIVYFHNKYNEYLCIAIENYIKFCNLDNSINSPSIYRIISMWFANKTNDKLSEIMLESIFEIPSYKFVCVLKQLTAHLNNNHTKFLDILQKIITNCSIDHPHHTLNHIYSLLNAYADDNSCNLASLDTRLMAVKKCLLIIKNVSLCYEITEQLEPVSLALIEFANKDLTSIEDNCYRISERIKKLRNLENVHCLTECLPICPSKNYSSNIITIIKWENQVELVGGINAPKKLYCLCSDGFSRPQLLKGKDDMRQDAIMQQVLCYVNSLLINNQDNFNQTLIIKTYTVVPLSKRSGIIEWCKNTIPLGRYLCGKRKVTGAHLKYRPQDWTAADCRKKMQVNLTKDHNTKLKGFLEICKNIHPVLQYFFFEKFRMPGVWFERRLCYMNSVAVSSVVGYVLGLGDRHCQNILLDQETGEFVHIDFGIAFEQGKVMPTPETIPFRLTREIVSPMGICEVDGIFSKSCEQTLRILRENSQALITILEVLLYDPLYSWTLNPKVFGALKNQVETEEGKNSLAQRSLIRIQSKLEGREDNQIGSLSVNIHVQKLIAEARNVSNLSRMFPGWEPYL